HWGTGEALNNGTHFVDIARWGLQVDYPTQVTSAGGRYRYKDDWETPDTQMISLEFGNDALMTWEGRSCNSAVSDGAGVGVIFYGEKGSMKIEAGNAYSAYDMDNKLNNEVKSATNLNSRDLTDPSRDLDTIHIRNFLDTIRGKDKLHSDIVSGH